MPKTYQNSISESLHRPLTFFTIIENTFINYIFSTIEIYLNPIINPLKQNAFYRRLFTLYMEIQVV